MKKYLKVMLVLVVALSLLCTFALANPFDITNGTDTSLGGVSSLNSVVKSTGGGIISIMQTIGYVVAVVMVLWIGIQWLMGTPAKKQELKGRMWSVLIGAILIIAGVSILGVVNNLATDVSTTISSNNG